MSERERWVVYPLLFLAIGLSLFQNTAEQQDHAATVDLLRCKTLEILGAQDKAKITLGTTEGGDGLMEFSDAAGKPEMRFGSGDTGASAWLSDASHTKYLTLGFNGPMTGLVAGMEGEKGFLLLTPLDQARYIGLKEEQPNPSKQPAKPEKADSGDAKPDVSKSSDSAKSADSKSTNTDKPAKSEK